MTAIAGESPAGAQGGAQRAVDLAISGMTCASCAARIEKKLNKLDGVTATVNFATDQARVSFPAAISPDDLISVVEQGLGISGVADGRALVVGRAGWLESEWAQAVPAVLADRAAEAEAAGQTAVFAGWDGRVRGVLIVADTIKPTSAEALRTLRGMGLRPVLLTGDNERAARAVADEVGIDEVIAGVLPAGKAAAAFAYNVLAIPLAALGFLSPLIAGAAMAFSSVFVVSNSLRLRRFRPAAGQPGLP